MLIHTAALRLIAFLGQCLVAPVRGVAKGLRASLESAHSGIFRLASSMALFGLALAALLPQISTAQQIHYDTFNVPQSISPSPFSVSCPAGTNILFCVNYVGTEPGLITDFYPPFIDPNAAADGGAGSTNYALQLTPNAPSQVSSVWFATPQDVVDGFTTWYTVKLNYQGGGDGNTADGLAFVIQNAAGGQRDAITGCFETGSGATVRASGGGCLGYGGIDNSVALEMDTFFDNWDPDQGSRGTSFSDNHLALQSCGLDVNGNPLANSPAHTTSPNCLITLGNGTSTLIVNPTTSVVSTATPASVLLSDGNPHQIVMIYNGPNESPANYLWVYLDATYNPGTHTPLAGSVPLFSGPFDLTKYMKLSNGGTSFSPAYVGFTAATGGDFEQHELMGWTFTPHANQPNFGPVTVCPAGQTTPAPCNETFAFTYNFPNGASAVSTQVLTQGNPNLDFKLTGNTCVGNQLPGSSCTVNVTFAPLAPGLRTGAVEIFDSNGNLLANTLISGIGQAPAAALGPGTQSVVPVAGLHYNVGVAVDAAGNTFVADYVAHKVVKYTPGGVQTTLPAIGLSAPIGVAVDGAGNVYIADQTLSSIVKLTPQGVQSQVGSNLSNPIGIAVDGSGDVFVADQNNNRVVEVTPAGVQTVVPTNALNQPWGVAVDAAGDVFVADGKNSRVIEVTPSGLQTTVSATGLSQPYGVAVDAAGDVYIADPLNSRVVEVPAGGGPQTTVGTALNYPSGVALDGAGNVVIGDQGSGQVVEVSRSQAESLSFAATDVGATSTDSPKAVTLQNIGNQPLNAVSSGLLEINGTSFAHVPVSGTPADCLSVSTLAAGAACKLSVSFTPQSIGNPLTGTAVFNDNALNASAASQTISLSGIGFVPSYPVSISLIGGGAGTVTDNQQSLSCTEASGATTGVCAGDYFSGSQVILTAAASGGSTFLGWGGACATYGNTPTCSVAISQAATVTASFVTTSFGKVNVCPTGQSSTAGCSTTIPITYNLQSTTTIGAIKVVTQGVAGLDFSQGSGSSCVGTISGGSSCTVNVNFTPLAPGLRLGAVEVYDSNANLVESTPISGIGQEPQIAYGPDTQTTVNTGTFALSQPKGLLTDAAGNLFISDTQQQRVLKIAPDNTVSTVGFGFQFPQGMAEDGAGNLFVADNNLDEIVEIPAGCTSSSCQKVIGSNLKSQLEVAVDGAGNLFFSDFLDGEIVESPAGCTTAACQIVIYNPAGSHAVGFTLDPMGNIYVGDFGLHVVNKIPAGCTSISCVVTIGTGFNQPDGVAVDAAGDVYVADAGLREIVEVPVGCTNAACQSVLVSGVNTGAVEADGSGNLYFDDLSNSLVFKLNRSQLPALSFPLTNVGSTSAPVSFTIQNIGNQPLTGSLALNTGGNFAQTANPDCSTTLPLAPGASCGESFSFTPQSATFLSGAALFTDNNLNGSPATQAIALSGTGAINGVAGTVTVPSVVGQVQAAAVAPITTAGLAVGTISSAASQTVPSGSIISQNPAPGTQVAVGSAVNLLVSTGLPQPPQPDPLSLNNNYFLTGDYVSAGVTLRGTGVGGIATGSITIPSYSQSVTGGVPDGADIVDAFLYWQTLESTPSASSTNGTFNHYPIVGQQIGNDIPNYVDGQFTGTIRSYRANVNVYLPVGANGIRFAAGTYTVSLPDSGGTALPLTEGASLVLIYRVLSPNFPLKAVVLYDGSAAPAQPGVQVMQGFYDAVGGASGTGKNTNIFSSGGVWNNSVNASATLGHPDQFSAPLNASSAYSAVILSTPVKNSDNDGILDAWKTGPPAGDFHAGQPGYYDVKTATWVGLPGAKHGQKDLFVQLDYMCGAVLSNGSCDPTKENLFPSPDTDGRDPLAMVQQAFANSGVQLHLQIGNAVPETTCTDDLTTSPPTLCQFPGQPGVIGWKNSLEFSKLYPRNLLSCLTGGDCTTRFPFGQKDSYHYVLMGHSLAIPAWNTRYGTLTSINVANGVTTIGTVDRGSGINACPSRITIAGVLGNPSLNGVYNTTSCADTKTITIATPGVPNYTYPNNTLPEPVIGITSGTISSISGYSDLGGADSAVTLGLWLTAPNQDMSKRANVLAGTIFHEIGHTLGLTHGGLYYDTPGSYVPTFEGNCKPNFQSIMNYLFQLDLVGPNQTLAFSNQTLNTLNENTIGNVTQLTDISNNAATFPTSAWYVPYTPGAPGSPATRHCDGTPLNGDSAYRVDAPIAPITPAWTDGQDINFIGTLQTQERGYNDIANLDLRQVGATGGEFASLASLLSFGSSAQPLNIRAGGNIALGSGGTVALGSGGTVTLGSGGNVTLGSGGTITLGSGGNVTLGSGGNVTLGSGGTIAPGSGGTVTLGSGGAVSLSSGGTITLGSGGTVTLGSGGTVTLGSGGTIALGSGGTVTIPSSGGSFTLDSSGGTITLGSGGNVTLGSGGNVTLGSGGTIALGSGGTVTLGSGGNVTLGSGGTITLGSGGTIALGSGGNVTLGSGGTIALGSGGTITLGSGGNVTLGSGGTVTLGSGGNLSQGSGGNVTLGSGGVATLGAGGTVTLGSGGNVTLGSGGNVTLGSGGTIALGSGGNVTLGSGGNVTLGSGGTIALGSGGTITLGSGGTVTLGSGGTVTLGSGGAPTPVSAGGTVTLGSGGTVTLGSGGNVTLGSGGNVTLGSGGTITLGSGGTIALGSGGNVTLGSGGTITLGSGGTVTLGSGGTVTLGSGGVVTLGNGGNIPLGTGSDVSLASVSHITPASADPSAANELTYETANSVVRTPKSPVETTTPEGVRITWTAPAFGVVQTYTIYRSSDGAAPIVIGSVSGINGNPPATEFTDTNPDLTSKTVVYTVTTTLVPDSSGPARQSQQSDPAVVKNDQSISLGPLPSSVLVTDSVTVTATATSGGVPNGLQVAFSATGVCSIGSQSIANNVTSAAVTLSGTGSCTIIASQPGTVAFNAANSVSGTFAVLAAGSTTKSQTINFPTLPSARYGGLFSLNSISSAGLPVTFKASGPCTTSGTITGVGVCTITASAAGNSTYSAASLTQSFTIYPAVLQVTATSQTMVYGQTPPSLIYSYSGFVNNDTAAVVTGAPALSTTVTKTSSVGSYPITVSTGTLASTNYSFHYVNGTLTVQPAPLSITPEGNKTKTYGATFTAFTGSIAGLVNNDAVTATYASTGAAATAAVGGYDITVAGYNFTSGSVSNYTVTENTATNGLKVLYASAGICDREPGHTILRPINADGTSVFEAGRTVPTQFRVCDANGRSVGPTQATPNVVTSYTLVGIYGATVTTVNKIVRSRDYDDTQFRWDPREQAWIFNTATGRDTPFISGYTYLLRIQLADGTVVGSSGPNGTIPNGPFPLGTQGFQFTLRDHPDEHRDDDRGNEGHRDDGHHDGEHQEDGHHDRQ